METEESSDYNIGISSIVKDLYKLRCLECGKEVRYKKAQAIIASVTDKLIKRQNYVAFRPMWEELHDRMVYYYNYLNIENLEKSIPLFRETLHNDVVKWWLECKQRGKLGSILLHFDTHDDMGLPASSKYLLKEGSLYEEGIHNGSCGQIYWPVTCILLSKGVHHVVWCNPKWVYDDDNGFEQTLVCWKKGDEFSYLRDKKENKDKFRIDDITLVKKISDMDLSKAKCKFQHPHRLDRLKLHDKQGWKKLGKMISGTSSGERTSQRSAKFVLDIDLDFFVTNGDKISLTEYKKNFSDIESHSRVHDMPGVLMPRASYDDPKSIEIIKLLNKEVKIIRKRVDTFLDGLEYLSDHGMVPSCINISDSAPSFFSGDSSKAVFTNQYTPKYFVPLLHVLLIDGLHEIYGKNKFL